MAIDSVRADFLTNESAVTQNNGAVRNFSSENYLHEAGLVRNASSGNIYYNGNREVIRNLGVHEYWNNSIDNQYSRNLGKGKGIELICIE